MHTPMQLRKRLTGSLTPARLRRCLIYKPLAVLMALLLLPEVSWLTSTGSAARPFQAAAQTLGGGCVASGNSILQNFCDANGTPLAGPLTELESKGVNAYLAEHGLPASDAHVIYDYGRSDLRSAVRAHMLAQLIAIINTPAASRTTNEQFLYLWLQGLVQKNEIMLYQSAVDQYNSWVKDACDFKLDPVIATQYGLSYDGSPWCGSSFGLAPLFDPDLGVPSANYFTTYGMKKSYGSVSDSSPNYGALLSQQNISLGTAFAIAGVAAGFLSAGIAAGSIAAALTPLVTITTVVSTGTTFSPLTGLLPTVTTATESFVPATMVLVPVAIIVMAIAIGVSAGFETFNYSKTLSELNGLSANLNSVIATPPDLALLAADSTGQGMYKLQNTFLARTLTNVCSGGAGQAASVPCTPGATLSDVPSTATLPAHRAGTDFAFAVPNSPNTQESFGYQDWNGAIWTVQTWNGWFVQTCTAGQPSTNPDGSKKTGKCIQPDSITADLYITDWSIAPNPAIRGDRSQWTASRLGNNFILTKGVNDPALHSCTADATAGVTTSTGGNFTTCSSYVTGAFNLIGGDGSHARMQLSPYSVPVFPAPYYMSFTAGQTGNQTIQAAGSPVPTLTVGGGTLTSDSDFTISGAGTSALKVTFGGSQTPALGDFTLTVNAVGYSGAAQSQAYVIHVNSGLAITSPDTLNGTAGSPVNFLVTTTGFPIPTLKPDPNLDLSGLTFKDNGNGTATISGTVAFPAQGVVCFNSGAACGIIATNTTGTVEQQFTINLVPSLAAHVVAPFSATFVAGIENRVLLTSTGATTPVSWELGDFSTPPSWLSLQNNGDGTAFLHGTPPIAVSGAFTTDVLPRAVGSLPVDAAYTINVVNTPVITSGNQANFTVGSAGTFQLHANLGNITTSDAMPAGLTFASGGSLNCLFCQGSISGTPAAGSGGQYSITVADNASTGSTTQRLTLNVYQAPLMTSTNAATMIVGMPGSFAVTTTGYPSVSDHPLPPNPQAPTSPAQGNGMYFTVSGLPSDLSMSNLSPQGYATGTLTIQGTPTDADAGLHQVLITVQNGVGTPVQQALLLNIVKLTGQAPASGTTCNGNYNGTFKGNLTVSAGQNCTFISGGVQGNINVKGGALALTNMTVGGNLTVQGGATFSLGPGVTIVGNLSIDSVASGGIAGQVCGVKLAGNLAVSGNAIPITIGSGDNTCPANVFAQNANINSNTAAVQVYGNTVLSTLACSSNTSITGGGNTAQKKNGQCAAF